MENTYNIQMRIKEIQNEKKRTDKLYKLSLIMFIPIIPLFFIGLFLEEPFLMKIACALFVIDPVFLICRTRSEYFGFFVVRRIINARIA